tara:strand:+ start:377 stop:619 length:243 start_codon:yes stop_codon:yes gene_type:complete
MKKILISVGVISILSFSYHKQKQNEPHCTWFVNNFKEVLKIDYNEKSIDSFTYRDYMEKLNVIEESIKNDCDCYDPEWDN